MQFVRLVKEDQDLIRNLFADFDEVYAVTDVGQTVDHYCAKLHCKLPVFGEITISYSTRERHFQVHPKSQVSNEGNTFYSGTLPEWANRAGLICNVQDALKRTVAESEDQRLTPAC